MTAYGPQAFRDAARQTRPKSATAPPTSPCIAPTFTLASRAALAGVAPAALRPSFELTAIDAQGGEGVAARATRWQRGQWRVPDRRRRPVVDGARSYQARGKLALYRRDRVAGRRRRAKTFPSPSMRPWSDFGSGPGTHLVHYPVRGGEDNIVAVTEGGAERQGWNQTGAAETLLASFARWTKDSKSLLERAEGWRSWSLSRLAPSQPLERGSHRASRRRGSPRVALSGARRRSRHRGRRHPCRLHRRMARRSACRLSPL